MLSNLRKIIRNNMSFYLAFLFCRLKILQFLAIFVSDDVYVKWQYKKVLGKELNLKNPVSFNEKIQWLKLYWRDERLTVCSDKYSVREYVTKRVGAHILTELYGVYDKAEHIVFEDLPKSFVLKVTHGCGQNVFCRNKKDVNWKYASVMLKAFLSVNQYYFGREFCYKNITPRIICEELLIENGNVPIDYKFYCFNGQPRFVDVHFDRFTDHKENFYDLNWNLLPIEMSYPNFSESFNKPQCFDEMCSYAARLAEDMPFVRVDFYNIGNKTYFGEMTFYPACGIDKIIPDSYDNVLGSYLKLPVEGNS